MSASRLQPNWLGHQSRPRNPTVVALFEPEPPRRRAQVDSLPPLTIGQIYSYGTATVDEWGNGARRVVLDGADILQTAEGLIPVDNALLCERCGRSLESDDAVSIIEGVCLACRSVLRGLVQPRRADQLITGAAPLDQDDFLNPKPRFQVIEREPLAGRSEPAPINVDHTPIVAARTELAAAAPRPSIASAMAANAGRRNIPVSESLLAPKTSTPRPTKPDISPVAAPSLSISPTTAPSRTPAPKKSQETITTIGATAPASKPAVPPPSGAAAADAIKDPIAKLREAAFAAKALESMSAANRVRQPIPAAATKADTIAASTPNPPASAPSIPSPSARAKSRRVEPPAPPFTADTHPRMKRRRRDLLVGTMAGLLLTLAIGYYAARRYVRTEIVPIAATVNMPELALKISPPTAEVKLDGESLGHPDSFGRINVRLPDANREAHHLEITAAGFHPLRQPVSTYLGAPEAAINLVRMPYELSIATNPPEAQVLINGEMRGTSPLKLTLDPSTDATLTVRREGFKDQTSKLQPPPDGEALALNYELIAAGQIVSIVTDPPHATIRIDGRLKGESPLRLELDPSYLGRNIDIAAVLDGYDNARLRVQLPEQGGGDVLSASLALSKTLARVNIYTDPPGGLVTIAGKTFGAAPVQVEFDPAETGKSVLVEASMNGTRFGRQEVTIPSIGQPTLLVVPMTFGAQRVVFLLASPNGESAEHFALADQLTRQIQTLKPSQHFSILAATDDGIEAWPGGVSMETATSEQKVRAYDMVRDIRPTVDTTVDALLTASLAFQPTTVWIFVEGDIDRAALERFDRELGAQQVSVNLVRATPLEDEQWFSDWTIAHRGTMNLLGRDMLPALAVDTHDDDQ